MPKAEGTSAERVSVPRILADLLMVGQLHKLPDPCDMYATYENGCVSVKFASFVDQDLWTDALGAKPSTEFTSKDGMRFCRVHATRRDGWWVTVDASEPVGPARHTDLPAATLTALDHIANPPAVSEERAEEILNQLNNGVIYPGDVTLHTAIAWAREQADVDADHTGHCPGGVEVRLVDGTLIVWSPDFQRWEFAAETKS